MCMCACAHVRMCSCAHVHVYAGALLGGLEALRLSESTSVVVHGDHGFSLGRHGRWSKWDAQRHRSHAAPRPSPEPSAHVRAPMRARLRSHRPEPQPQPWPYAFVCTRAARRYHLYEDATRVPLIVAVPGGRAAHVDTVVESLDVTPTLAATHSARLSSAVRTVPLACSARATDRVARSIVMARASGDAHAPRPVGRAAPPAAALARALAAGGGGGLVVVVVGSAPR